MTTTTQILLVDDDTALLQALPQMLHLRMREAQVDTCSSALEALEKLQANDYDAIISDIKMPGMDGLELLSEVRRVQPDTPTLLITGHGEHDLAIRALRGGAYDYIQKPIDRDSFVAALQRAIQTRQLRRTVLEQHLALQQHARSLETLVQKRTEELVEANASKDKFLNIVGHELKSPLTNIKAISQHLLSHLDSEDGIEVARQGITDIERALGRTEVLIHNLLDTSQIESNMFVLHRKPCDLLRLCHDLINEYTQGAGPTLASEFMDQPIEAEIDENRICQVLINLLSNARKYSLKGSPITITLQQSGYEAIIGVRDSGIGIPPEEQERIFEQFYRAPGSEVQDGSRTGLGLGLYISRKIVERHGGHIEVQSAPDEGSTFSVVLPLYVSGESEAGGSDEIKLMPQTQALWTITH